VALLSGRESLTYAEAEARVDRAHAALRAHGVPEGGFVGLHVQRSPRSVVSLLAILRAGCAVVPLPPSYPRERLEQVLSFAELEAVVDDEATPLPAALDAERIRLDDGSGPREPGGGSREADADPDRPAFVLCSSGSTGTPKMIVRSHRSFFHRLEWTWRRHPFEEGELGCQKAHMATTHSVYELFEPILAGAPVLVVPDRDVRSLEGFWSTVRARSVTRLLMVPSMLQASLAMPRFEAPPLRVLVLMGEYVHPDLAARVVDAFPASTHIYSIYGSTEASSTLVCDLRVGVRRGGELALGTPIADEVEARVLDDALEPVAEGEEGMLYIGGPPLFSGYYGDPERTEDVLVTPPGAAARLYRTNDRVRRMPDGALQYLGRTDDVVKIRGFRVDVQEVERSLLRHPEVRAGAVVVAGEPPDAHSLMAFVVPETVNPGAVRDLLSAALPPYMVPSVIEALAELPRTRSGKVDRQKLIAQRETAAPSGLTADLASGTERQVADVWHDVLPNATLGPESSFFAVGGTSLTVFAAVHRLREAFGLRPDQLSDLSLYQYPTLRSLALHIDGLRTGGVDAAPPRRNPVLTTMRSGDDTLSPLYAFPTPGGTVGAYERVVAKLVTDRQVMGLRDPLLWNGREATAGPQEWIDCYLDAIRERQPHGPYYLMAYSSAGFLGYEIACRLRRDGEPVPLLALVDPFGIDRMSRLRYGYWAMRGRFMRPSLRSVVRLGGELRRLLPWWARRGGGGEQGNGRDRSPDETLQAMARAERDRELILSISALMELNTGMPFALREVDFEGVEPARYLELLISRVGRVAPEVDTTMIENLVRQYGTQVRAQQRYRLGRYDGRVVLFEPASPYAGLVPAHFRPYVRDFRSVRLPLGAASDRTRELARTFTEPLRAHYLSMRDDLFSEGVARGLSTLLQQDRM